MNIQNSFLRLKGSHESLWILEANGELLKKDYDMLFCDAIKILGGLQEHLSIYQVPVVLQFSSIYKQLTTFWACVMGGYVPIILPLAIEKRSSENLESILNTLENPVIITDIVGFSAGEAAVIFNYKKLNNDREGRIKIGNDHDAGMIQFTSGTTSKPKGAVLTLSNLHEGAVASSIVVRPDVQERYISWLPLSHSFGFIGYHLVPLYNNFPQFLINPICFVKTPLIWLRLIDEFNATMTGIPMFGIEALINTEITGIDLNLESMYICFCGGEDVNAQKIHTLEKKLEPLGWKKDTIKPAYGLSETTMGVAHTPYGQPLQVDSFLGENIGIGNRLFFIDDQEDTLHRVSVGILDECNEVSIRDEKGNILEEDFLGIVHIRGSNVMKGYYVKSSQTYGVGEDGWFNTGDLGFFHNGWLNIFGRIKNIVILNGENYLVTDLEKTGRSALESEDAVFIIQGLESEKKTSCLVMVTTCSDTQKIKNASKAISKKWGIPIKWWVTLEEIPLTSSGKIDRLGMQVSWENGSYVDCSHKFGEFSEEILNENQKKMAGLWGQVLKISPNKISKESRFIADCMGDSLSVMDLTWRIEKEFEIVIDYDRIKEDLSLEKMTALVLSAQNK